MSDLTADERLELAAAAQARSEFDQLENAFAEVRAGMLEAIASSAFEDTLIRERLYMGVNVLDNVKAVLIRQAAGAEVARNAAAMREIMSDTAA